MAIDRFRIRLDAKKDKYNNTYYIGKMKAPINLNFKDGVVFMIFISDPGQEEIQITELRERPGDLKEEASDTDNY